MQLVITSVERKSGGGEKETLRSLKGRIFLKANYPPTSVVLTVDVTTGDVITPGAIEHDYLV